MKISGWDIWYRRIVRDFGYSRKKDAEAASALSAILRSPPLGRLGGAICGRPVFVIGAGPSLSSSLDTLKKFRGVTKICADTAVAPLVKNGIRPHIIVTDLDGDLELLKRLGRTNITFVVHAHGDNIEKLEFARDFKVCIGTTQTRKIGKAYNFGGFTDGDRAVFMAEFFGASQIFLFGMDFGRVIGSHSKTKKAERLVKLKKLRYGRMLLEWLAPKSEADLFTLSRPIKGFKKITYRELKQHLEN